MPRKDFQSHLAEAQSGPLPPNIISIQPGQDDGTFIVLFSLNDGSMLIEVQAQASDVGDYPKSHSFFIYTDAQNLPRPVSAALQDVSILASRTINQAVSEIANKLDRSLTSTSSGVDTEMGTDYDQDFAEDYSDPADLENGFCPLEDEDDDDIIDGFGSPDLDQDLEDSRRGIESRCHKMMTEDERTTSEKRIREDITNVRNGGFRVAHQGDILTPGAQSYLMISIRIAKLRIPEDALEAWHLQPEEYLMLLIRYNHGYRTLESLKDSVNASKHIKLYVLVSKTHKLTTAEISEVMDTTKKQQDENEVAEEINDTEHRTRALFIGHAINELLNSRLVTLMRCRRTCKFNWPSAMAYYNDKQGIHGSFEVTEVQLAEYFQQESQNTIAELSHYLRADHLENANAEGPPPLFSFPLAAFQFTLRHVARCTEFCLVCFDRTKDEFEALKPYVCSKPLCLYQYMSMGLGPGIEFEILSQPQVVDLLTSFCYSSTNSCSLRSLPEGLGLMVPDPILLPGHPLCSVISHSYVSATQSALSDTAELSAKARTEQLIEATWTAKNQELKLPHEYDLELGQASGPKFLRPGDNIVFWSPHKDLYHCKITEVCHPVYKYQHLVKSNTPEGNDFRWTGKSIIPTSKTGPVKLSNSSDGDSVAVQIAPYSKLFDSLDRCAQHAAIRLMLDTLPSVAEMAGYLRTSRGKGRLLKWHERVVPAALGFFRWIIASNRSCIVSIDPSASEELVYGMPGYLQFKFASGAPDKESRFLRNVAETKMRTKKLQPTIFAWHGSQLKNWHSIIREGLDFKDVINGRAYGNGVYHAMQSDTSLAYARGILNGASTAKHWPSSMLNITQALSLNELVNAPNEFVSKSPHLVVQHVDWIQTRYLFVKAGTFSEPEKIPARPSKVMLQDEAFTPVNSTKSPLVIPACAISKARRQYAMSGFEQKTLIRYDAGHASILDSDTSDSDDASLCNPRPYKRASDVDATASLLAFEPGTLNRACLPMLAAPTYATSSSSKALQREIRALLKEQSNTPLHELGWYLDPGYLDNPYQWIVELHSFDKSLPLAKDMAARNISSIVLEIRFGPNFNFSPPFLRVIKPRFLPFLSGGGGHVTAGGAMCMELLTSNGWNPSATMSSVLLQVRLAMTSMEPKPARLETSKTQPYGIGEAMDAYSRACQAHGWKVAEDFRSMALMTIELAQDEASASKKQRRQ